MKKNTLLLVSLLLFGLLSHSQNLNKAINSFQDETQAIITINRNLLVPSFIKLPLNKHLSIPGKTVKEKAHNFLLKNQTLYAITNLDESLPENGVLKTDNHGLKHYEVKQFHKGVPIFDGGLKFHFDKYGNLASVNGNIIPNIELNVVPNVKRSVANAKAVELVKDLNRSGEPLKVISSELIVFPKGLVQGNVTSKHLVYHIEVRNDLDVREFLFIDAHTGKLIEQFTGIAHALDRVLYEADTSNKTWEEGLSFPGFLNEWQQSEVATAGQVYNFFNNAFGYTSYDGNDAQMVTINNNPNINCPNATWNGVSANYCDGTASDDVVAHEWGHAYTQFTNNLVYAFESGAMNEAYSDIWGETVDLLNGYNDDGEDNSLRTGGSVTNRWKMGEDATAFGGAIRDMWTPEMNGDPGKMSAGQYNCDIADNDNGGVHTNSGIPNHAYALLVDGGTYNGQTIASLGFVKAAHIFWRAQSEYLTASSDFEVLSDALEAACADLVGINLQGLSTTDTPAGLSGEIITIADCQEVSKALIAVEMKEDNGCPYDTILSASTALCEAATSNPVYLQDWEAGLGAWTATQIPTNPGTWESRDWVIETSLPDDRVGQGVFAPNPINGDCAADLQNGILRLESPTITMPNYTEGTFSLAFNHNVASETDYDGGNIKFSLDGGAWTILPASAFTENAYNLTLNNTNNDSPMSGEEAFSGADTGSYDSVWGQSTIDLSAIGVTANSTLKLRWEFGSDGCNGRIGWYVDEIVIFNCAEALSINDFDFLDNNVSIYPNPSSGTFNIEMKSINDFRYDIYDITGKAIMNRVDVINNAFEVNLNNYSKGVYFFKLYSSEGSITKKLIIQ